MKKTAKILTLVLAMLMIFSLIAACGTTEDPVVSQTPSEAPTESPTVEPSEEPLPEPGNPTLPLTDTPVTFSWYFPITQEGSSKFGEYSEMEGRKELARRTGVDIDFVSPIIGMDAEQFNLMITSGDYTDLVNNAVYTGGLDKAVDDGVYLAINDIVDKYAPNYKNWLDNSPGMKRDAYTDNGNMVGFYQLHTLEGKSRPWGGFYIRQDWMNDLGLPTPVTYDDWYTTLKAFKDEKGAESALFLNKSGYYLTNDLNAGYQVGYNFYQVDGRVKFGPLESGFRDYLTTLNKWFDEGLIAQDFMTNQSMFYMPDTSYTTTGKSGIFWNVYMPDMLKLMSGNEEYELAAILPPVRNAGDKLHFSGPAGAGDVATGPTVAITTACEDPILAARWADYQYSPDGYMLSNWGIEGVSYEMVDGQPKYVDMIDDKPFADEKGNWVYMYGPTVYDFDAEYSILTEVQLASTDVWSQADNAYAIPSTITLTVEEGERNSLVMNEINTYVSEMILKFIIGNESFDNYDAFIAQIKSMGIDEIVDIQQAALDRYYARGK